MSRKIPSDIFRREVESLLLNSISDDYVWQILDLATENGFTVFDDIKEDVELSSGWYTEGEYNEDDIRLSVGRVLLELRNRPEDCTDEHYSPAIEDVTGTLGELLSGDLSDIPEDAVELIQKAYMICVDWL